MKTGMRKLVDFPHRLQMLERYLAKHDIPFEHLDHWDFVRYAVPIQHLCCARTIVLAVYAQIPDLKTEVENVKKKRPGPAPRPTPTRTNLEVTP